jgi:hypothetical protein
VGTEGDGDGNCVGACGGASFGSEVVAGAEPQPHGSSLQTTTEQESQHGGAQQLDQHRHRHAKAGSTARNKTTTQTIRDLPSCRIQKPPSIKNVPAVGAL